MCSARGAYASHLLERHEGDASHQPCPSLPHPSVGMGGVRSAAWTSSLAPSTAITLDACADGRTARGCGAPEGCGDQDQRALRARWGRRLSAPWSSSNTHCQPGLLPRQGRGQMVTDRWRCPAVPGVLAAGDSATMSYGNGAALPETGRQPHGQPSGTDGQGGREAPHNSQEA